MNANNSGIPWHSGALKYFEEIEIKIPSYVREENFES